MCEHCDTILDVLRDAPVTSSYDNPPGGMTVTVSVDFDHWDADRRLHRAQKLAAAISGICGKRKLVEVEDKPIKPRPSQKKKAAKK